MLELFYALFSGICLICCGVLMYMKLSEEEQQ